jgi:hypothetical protein
VEENQHDSLLLNFKTHLQLSFQLKVVSSRFFTVFRKCTAPIKDTDERASSPYCAFNPQKISAGLTLFHQEFDDTALFYTRSD